MRILFKTAHPDMPTAYAQQTALILPRLQALGHDVAVSCTAGQISHHSMWRGIPVFGCTPYTDTGEDTLRNDYEAFGADLVISFLCTWILKFPAVWRDLRTIHLTPVDCNPMSVRDYRVIEATGGTPAAVSRTGLEIMRRGGKNPARPDDPREPLDPLYLPHGTDLKVFTPPADRAAVRAAFGYGPDTFVVGMNFHNNDKFRKNLQESIRAFAGFHQRHPDSVLAMHAIQALPEGYNLLAYTGHLGLTGARRFTPQWELLTGMVTPKDLADWYGCLDVYLGTGNEGYGLPAIEAQACGTPVILADASTGPELVGDGWLVGGQPWWNDIHQADWLHASIAETEAALEEAYEDARNRRAAARDNAHRFDINKMITDHWEKVLGELG